MRGYVKDKDGHILYKLDLPSDREHKLNLKKGEVFVADNKIDKIEVWQPKVAETEEEKRDRFINERMRKIAEDQLIREGIIKAKKEIAYVNS